MKIEHLDSLLKQLPSPYLLLGDFNGHNILWGNKENNSKGELIENFITNNDIWHKSNTYMHYPTGSFSSIDLSCCHPSLFLDFNWSVCKDQHHSDHFPIIIKSNTSTVEDHNPKWKLNKANWEVFLSLCTDKINFKDSSDPYLISSLPLLIYLLNVYQRPRQIQQKVIHGTMMNVKKLLKRGKKL